MFRFTHGKQLRAKISNVSEGLRISGAQTTLFNDPALQGPVITFSPDNDYKQEYVLFLSTERSINRQLLRVLVRLLRSLGVSAETIQQDVQWGLHTPSAVASALQDP